MQESNNFLVAPYTALSVRGRVQESSNFIVAPYTALSSCGWVQESSNLLLTEVAPYTAQPAGSVEAEVTGSGFDFKCYRKALVLS